MTSTTIDNKNTSADAEQSPARLVSQAFLQGILNKFRVPVAALTEQGVLACNRQMLSFIHQHPLLEIDNGRIVIIEFEQNQQLQTAISGALALANQPGRDHSNDGGDAMVFDPQPEHELGGFTLGIETVRHDSPLCYDDDNPSACCGALLYAIAPHIIQTPSVEQLRRVFQLTEAEARCCHLFASGLPLKQVAGREHKSIYTVREQIENAYRKTGARSQLELINTLAALPACG